MGFLRRVGQWISNAAEDVAEFVEDAVNAVVEFVSDVLGIVGTFFQDVFEWIGDRLGGIPGIGPILEYFFDWIGDVIGWTIRLVTTAVKGVGSIVGGVLGGAIRILGGILSLNGGLILEGLSGIAHGILGALFVFFPTLLGFLQTAFLFGVFQRRSRRLTEAEIAILRRVYGDSIAFNNVRIVVGFAGFYSLGSAAVVFGNMIYFKDNDPLVSTALFVHEACHVWQYQHVGSRYTSDALAAQLFNPGDTGYEWETYVAAGVTTWEDLNAEAQAEVFFDLWAQGQLITDGVTSLRGSGVFYDANGTNLISLMEFPLASPVDRTAFCDEAVATVRGAQNWRLSSFWS